MSLINDALKEAQRERSGRSAIGTAGPLVENIFPYPDARKSPRSPLLVVLGVAAAVSVLIAVGVVAWARMNGPSVTKHVPPQTKSVSAPRSTPASPSPAPESKTQTTTERVVATTSDAARPKSPPLPPVQPSLSRPTPTKPAVAERGILTSKPTSPAAQTPSRTPAVGLSQTKLGTDSVAPPSAPAPAATRSASTNPPDAPAASRGDASAVRLVIDPTASGPADSLFRLAYAEQMQSNLDGAQALYEKAIATQHAPAEAYNDYGVLLLARGNKTAATEMFRQALNHDDKNVEAWVNLGDSFNGMGYHGEAMAAYARANQLDPARAAVKTRISREYEAIGDTASARRYLEDAIKASPKDAAAHYALGAYLQRAHDYHGAIREFESFVDLSPAQDNQEFVLEMRRHISALKRVAP